MIKLPDDVRLARLTDVQKKTREVEHRLQEVHREIVQLESRQVGKEEIAKVLANFDGVWDALKPTEKVRVIELLVQQVAWDSSSQDVSITFHATGIRTLAQENAEDAA